MTALRCNSCGKTRETGLFCPECGSQDYSYVTLPDPEAAT